MYYVLHGFWCTLWFWSILWIFQHFAEVDFNELCKPNCTKVTLLQNKQKCIKFHEKYSKIIKNAAFCIKNAAEIIKNASFCIKNAAKIPKIMQKSLKMLQKSFKMLQKSLKIHHSASDMQYFCNARLPPIYPQSMSRFCPRLNSYRILLDMARWKSVFTPIDSEIDFASNFF